MAAARFAGPPACLDQVARPLGARLAVLVLEHPRPVHESRTARMSAELQIRARVGQSLRHSHSRIPRRRQDRQSLVLSYHPRKLQLGL